MSPLTRANCKETAKMPCCDLDVDGIERESAMLTALFDPTDWPPLLSLMDNTSTTTNTSTTNNSGVAEKRKQTECALENWCKKPKLESESAAGGGGDDSNKKKRGKKKDERRKLLKISINKLRSIDDAETFLRRSVLIHNTVRRLQKEMEQERSGDPWEDEEPYGVSENVLQISIGESKCDNSRQQTQQTECAGGQCATQYRTSQGNGHQGESVFDSVVYQSLLVSLES